jgi:hypothetical protein
MEWQPAVTTELLDKRLDNALRRAAGSIGFDISMDRGRMRTLTETAESALNAGLQTPGPLFMRVGSGLFAAGGMKMGESLDPGEAVAEILYEFHTEAVAAFQTLKTSLYADALAHMQGGNLNESHRAAVLAAADNDFAAPEKEQFTKVGLPFIKTGMPPSTQAILGGIAGFVCALLLTRAPIAGLLAGAAAGVGAYSFARRRIRRKCERLLWALPRNLYSMLATDWNAGIRRYADIVNAGTVQKETVRDLSVEQASG